MQKATYTGSITVHTMPETVTPALYTFEIVSVCAGVP